WILIAILGLAACAPSAPSSPAASGGGAAPEAPRRTLVVANRVEPNDVAAKAIRLAGLTLGATKRFFNAGLVIADDQGVSQPYLAEQTPKFNTDSWTVASDGTMETTYRLLPNLTWHDGHPLTSDDFA